MRRRRRRRGRRGRIPTPVYIGHRPAAEAFIPQPTGDKPPIVLEPAELEALRLVDLEGLTQEEAGVRMGISRGTIWRLLQRARRKVAQALTEALPIQLSEEEQG
ncbi:MAG: DUF134 domain-containing protein [Candidatus Bathyarchaeia archaeon]